MQIWSVLFSLILFSRRNFWRGTIAVSQTVSNSEYSDVLFDHQQNQIICVQEYGETYPNFSNKTFANRTLANIPLWLSPIEHSPIYPYDFRQCQNSGISVVGMRQFQFLKLVRIGQEWVEIEIGMDVSLIAGDSRTTVNQRTFPIVGWCFTVDSVPRGRQPKCHSED